LDEASRRLGIQIESYVEFNTDMLTIRAGDTFTRISRCEMEDGKHIAKLRDFVEMLMCGSKGSTPVTSPRTATEQAMYQALAQQQSAPRSIIRASLIGTVQQDLALVRKAVDDNQYRQAWAIPEKVVPKIEARELTKEELRARLERKSTSPRRQSPTRLS
jgi:hypothetical protein